MSWIAALLIITSAFMHASWNFVSKRHNPSLAYFFIAAASAALVTLPVLVLHGHALSQIPPGVWALIVATGAAQAVYFSGLAGAYRHGDMSLAYPLARALPVLAVAAISLLAGRGGEISRTGLLGMLFISAAESAGWGSSPGTLPGHPLDVELRTGAWLLASAGRPPSVGYCLGAYQRDRLHHGARLEFTQGPRAYGGLLPNGFHAGSGL